MADIRVQNLKAPVDVAEYLFTRLHQIGLRSVHGVPGDYNLAALDYIPKASLKWVGSVNELNAAYAADGYARVNTVGAIVTTFGVGELSAANGLAGAYSEHVPVIHIVGCPSTHSQRQGQLLHHTLGNGDFNVFADMAARISCCVVKLNEPADVAVQIDHAIRECFVKSRPVYLMLPSDIVKAKVEGQRLEQPIDLSDPGNDPEQEAYIVDVMKRYLEKAKIPVILIDACAVRHRVLDEVHSLVEKLNIPVFVTPMGKGAIDESHRNYGGTYAGEGSQPRSAKDFVESSDLVLSIGTLKSDFNSAGFSYRTSKLKTIHLHSDHCIINYSTYPGARMKGVLRRLVDAVDPSKISSTIKVGPVKNEVRENDDGGPSILHAWFWPRMGEFFAKGDIVVSETGTSNFGIWSAKLPAGAVSVNQTLWGSIGWSVGAAQGACLAARDLGQDRRTILFVGDGSFQLTAQELSTMIRLGLRPIIFLINNEGYTIERFLHGMDAEYNDVNNWDYTALTDVFGGAKCCRRHVVKTKAELEKLLADPSLREANYLEFVEVFMPKKDAPAVLVGLAEANVKMNE